MKRCRPRTALRASKSDSNYGIATWLTEGFNQRGERVIVFTRSNLVPRKDAAPKKDTTEQHISWTPLPTEPQVRRRSTDALPWRPTERMRWER